MTVLTTAIPCSTYNWICRTPAVLEQVLRLSKWAKNSSKDFQQGLLLTTVLPIFYKPSTASVVVKLCTWRSSTDIQPASVKVGHYSTGFQILSPSSKCACRPSRGFQEVLWWSNWLSKQYRPSTSIGAVKTCFSNLYRPSTNFLAAKTLSPNFYRHSSSFAVVEMDLLNLYISLTENAVVKTYLLNLHRYWTRIAVVKTAMTILYRLLTRFTFDKTGLENIYRISTRSAVVKTTFSNFYKPSKEFTVLQTCFPNICRASTGFAAFKTVAPPTVCSNQNHLSEFLQASTGSVVVKPYMTILHRWSTRFTVVKTWFTIHYRQPTGFAVVETDLQLSKLSWTTSAGVELALW